ncbi:MAG TPA: asparagine synthase-related protein [Gemmatimonadaceae bacterium]
MTAILGVVGYGGAPPLGDDIGRRMLGAMRRRGAARAGLLRQGPVVLAVARQGWELDPDFSGAVLAVEDGDCAVVADASLYYRDDLRRRLAAKGVHPAGPTPSHLILAAYRAWGEECAKHLEGDFAFVLWDARRRRLVCARDHVGQRPLFHATLGDAFVVASTIAGVRAHPRCGTELDLQAIAIDAAGLIFSGSAQTCHRGIAVVPAGHTMVCGPDGTTRITRWWDPEVRPARSAATFDDAADELRAAIERAVAERLHSSAVTTVWLSGGHDSTAVYGAGQRALARSDAGHRLRPVSVSYPPGDPGREDERIAAVARFWRGDVTWVNIDDIPMFDGVAERAARRDEPYGHLFEQWVRWLARGSRGCDARVVLNGHGGDFLFQSTPIYLADLLSTGRVLRLAREWRAMGVQQARLQHLFHWAVQPLIPQPVLRLAEHTRGRRFEGYFDRPVPAWFAPRFVREHDLAERARGGSPRWPSRDRSGYEMRWYLVEPFYPRVNGCTAEYALEEGVETRSPLYDTRVIRLAAARPWHERNSLGETKRLLRRAMRGILPDEAVAARTTKTGTLRGYFTRSMMDAAPLFRAAFREPLLAEVGIVDAERLRRAADVYFRHGGVSFLAEQLLSTFQAELWLRARLASEATKTSPIPEELASVAAMHDGAGAREWCA